MINRARECGLDVFYCNPTLGDGNCWYRAIVEQIHRKSVYNRIPEGLRFTDVGLLRVQVLNYIRMNEKEFEFIREFRGVSYPQEKDWQNFLSNQATNTVYVEHLAILCTAYFLGVEICVTTETCHKERPYFSYNRDSHSEISLWVANYQNCHFQSLIPTNDSVMNHEISNCLIFTPKNKKMFWNMMLTSKRTVL